MRRSMPVEIDHGEYETLRAAVRVVNYTDKTAQCTGMWTSHRLECNECNGIPLQIFTNPDRRDFQ